MKINLTSDQNPHHFALLIIKLRLYPLFHRDKTSFNSCNDDGYSLNQFDDGLSKPRRWRQNNSKQ